jgi:hypothetical protein
MKSRNLACLLATAALCAVTPVSQASVSFQNAGSTSGWSGTNIDSGCSVTNSTSVIYRGSGSFKARTTWNGASHRYHAMMTRTNAYSLGGTGFYGFAFFLSNTWDQSGSQQYQLFQFIANYSSTGCDDWQPSTMVWVSGNRLNTRRNYGSSACNRTTQTFSGLATVTRGVWNRVVIQGRWVNDSSGFLRLWYNGSQVLNFSGATTINASNPYRMDVGLYANSWYDQGQVTGQSDRQAWFDNIRIATTYGEADPASW